MRAHQRGNGSLEVTTLPLTDVAMDGTYHGVPVASFGEDGNALALGHHDPRQAAAAFDAHARDHLGLCNVLDNPHIVTAEIISGIRHDWVVFRKADPEREPEWEWCAKLTDRDNPHATPVTILFPQDA